jgi:hypothetical protein
MEEISSDGILYRINIWQDCSHEPDCAELIVSFGKKGRLAIGTITKKRVYFSFFKSAFQSEDYNEIYQEACFKML